MRSKWKGKFSIYLPADSRHNAPIIYSRNSTIDAFWLGKRVLIYNGCRFVSLLIKPFYIGKKFGEFVPTKKTGTIIHATKKNKRKKR